MNDGFYALVAAEHLFQSRTVQTIDLLESRTHARNLTNIVHHISTRIRQVIHDDNFISALLKLHHRMGTYISRSTRY